MTAGDYYVGQEFAGLRQFDNHDDTNGITSNNYDLSFTYLAFRDGHQAFAQTTITSRAPRSASATFYLTQGAYVESHNGRKPGSRRSAYTCSHQGRFPICAAPVFSGQIGSTANPPIMIQLAYHHFGYTRARTWPCTLVNDCRPARPTITCAEQAGAGHEHRA